MTEPVTTGRDRVAETVRRYLDAVAARKVEEIVALYTEDATVEDPVGGDPVVGHEAIRGFYGGLGDEMETELRTLRVAGDARSAAFHFLVRTTLPDGGVVEIEPIDVMTFDDEGRITGMRAYWSPSDIRML